MRGSFVAAAIVNEHKHELSMTKPWNIRPELVASDGEIFSFPCRIGSGLSGLLNVFLTELIMTKRLDALVTKHIPKIPV